ncbi:MAG TPA: iron-sulfur cluster assembly protein [Nitrosopumilaceae archaeon]|jgi:metal-sulfur cluster biosynthetic enzyme
MTQDVKLLRVKIFDELSKIVDPEINTTITDLELVDEVDINNSNVRVDLHLTSPFCPAVFGFKIAQDIHDKLLKIDGIDDVKVNVSNHFMAEQINNQVNNSPNPKKQN